MMTPEQITEKQGEIARTLKAMLTRMRRTGGVKIFIMTEQFKNLTAEDTDDIFKDAVAMGTTDKGVFHYEVRMTYRAPLPLDSIPCSLDYKNISFAHMSDGSTCICSTVNDDCDSPFTISMDMAVTNLHFHAHQVSCAVRTFGNNCRSAVRKAKSPESRKVTEGQGK